MKYYCKNCGKEFSAKPSQKRLFCCWGCAQSYHKKFGQPLTGKRKVDYVKVTCEVCGKMEYVLPCRAKNYHTCSKHCAGELARRKMANQIECTCAICGKKYYVKPSLANRIKTCGNEDCKHQYRVRISSGQNNPRYVHLKVENGVYDKGLHQNGKRRLTERNIYMHVVKNHFGWKSYKQMPEGYSIHHKDCNHSNNDASNLVIIPRTAHMLLHRWFGNILLNAVHTGKLSREVLWDICDCEQRRFYEQIIDLNITHQVVVKQGELLENPEVDNQQPSVYRNIYEGSTTNNQTLTGNAEGGNIDTSALPDNKIIGDDIV